MADEQRTLALGLQSLLFRATGTIPGPIIFGVIFDSICLFWQFDCDRRGNCWVYNNVALGDRAMALALSGIVANFIFSFLAWLSYPKSKTVVEESKSKESNNPTEEEMSSLKDKSL